MDVAMDVAVKEARGTGDGCGCEGSPRNGDGCGCEGSTRNMDGWVWL